MSHEYINLKEAIEVSLRRVLNTLVFINFTYYIEKEVFEKCLKNN